MIIYLGDEMLRVQFQSGKGLDIDGHTGEAHYITITPVQDALCLACGHELAKHADYGCMSFTLNDEICPCGEAVWPQ